VDQWISLSHKQLEEETLKEKMKNGGGEEARGLPSSI
jgi:hypothetical protein